MDRLPRSTAYILAAVSTPIPNQNSTAVSIRGGLGASASTTFILSAVSTLAAVYKSSPVPIRSGSDVSASTTFILSRQISTAISKDNPVAS